MKEKNVGHARAVNQPSHACGVRPEIADTGVRYRGQAGVTVSRALLIEVLTSMAITSCDVAVVRHHCAVPENFACRAVPNRPQ